jgi:hypothetical protein
MNDRALRSWLRRDAHPIADRWKIGGGTGFMAEATTDFRPPVEIARDATQAALLLDNSRHSKLRDFSDDLFLEETIPAETLQ